MDELGIYQQIEKALHRKVWLKSGGYIVIDRTEALTAIDVNTGKYTGSDNLEQTVWRTNREAVKEIARQVRLRDIGGMIIIDFIDMADPSHRKDVLEALTDAFRDDRSRTTIQGLTQLGLVEMTRKKSRHDLESLFMIVCPTCLGRGKIYKHTSQVDNIIRRLFELKEEHDSEAFFVEVNSHLGAQIIGPAGSRLEQLEKSLGRKIYVKGSDTMMAHQVEIRQGTEAQVRKWAIPVEKGELIELYIEEKHMNYPENGIGRISGFVINVKNGAQYLHQKVKVLITEVNRTFARGIVKAPPK
jgi:ribonuclease G